jgi:hypothetical protein
MTGPVVPNIESLGVGGPEPLHAFGQVCTIGAKQKMKHGYPSRHRQKRQSQSAPKSPPGFPKAIAGHHYQRKSDAVRSPWTKHDIKHLHILCAMHSLPRQFIAAKLAKAKTEA